jgi:DNA repair protein RadC
MELAERIAYACEHDRRPREKLLVRGPEALSDTEVISLLIGSGQQGNNVESIAGTLVHMLAGGCRIPTFEELIDVRGVGGAIASRLCAAFELGRRVFVPRGTSIRTPEDAFNVVRHIGDRNQEHFLVLTLNGAHELIRSNLVSIGLVNRTVIHPREVYAPALEDRAAAIIVAHNHPSGNLEPSLDDEEVTERLNEAGELLGIRLLDHVIFASDSYSSFVQEGRL